MSAPMMKVEICYALPNTQVLLELEVPTGTSVRAAIEASGILRQFPEIDLAKHKVGIFAKLVDLDAPLRHQDRVEIYRPLIADPKEVRRQRVADGKAMKKGGGVAK